MILHPGILALLSVSTIILLVMLAASFFGIKILFCWDSSSSSEEQLHLERKTWLVSSLVNYALAAQILSAALFVFTADDIHRLFVGAMCATGSLNANLVGWLVLLVKGLLLFSASLWVVFNRLDQRTEDTPLIRVKYLFLLLLTPFVALDLYAQWSYFRGLQPEVITSCCGSLFSAEGEGVAAELSGLPVEQAMWLFFSMTGFFLACLILTILFRHDIFRLLLFVASVLFFFTSLGAVISFISLYVYQMPSHHCPFDMLQHHYGYIGYPLYIGLFVATLFGLLPGLAQPFKKTPSLKSEIEQIEQKWLIYAFIGVGVFLLCSCWHMLFGSFRLLGY